MLNMQRNGIDIDEPQQLTWYVPVTVVDNDARLESREQSPIQSSRIQFNTTKKRICQRNKNNNSSNVDTIE